MKLKSVKPKPDKPRILLTTGDPNGIGPEIILKIFSNKKIISSYDLYAIGSKSVFDHYSSLLKLTKIHPDKIIEIAKQKQIAVSPGKIDRAAGKLSGNAVKKAIELCLHGKLDAIVTLPISKEAFNKAGFDYPGHTEMLNEMAGSDSATMIMYSKNLILSLITVHIPLSYVNKKITGKAIIKKVISFNNSLVRDFNIKLPRIALLALNPHAGDGGKLGDSELKVISPAMAKLKDAGFNIEGPFPADGFFANKAYTKFDGTMAMYHDQGLIPFKMISKDKGVNYTAGIDIIRTSPNHGTGFDIAGNGVANPNSTIEAINLATKLISNKN